MTLSVPPIYSGVLPFVFLDIRVAAYQSICFPIYGIPKVRRTTSSLTGPPRPHSRYARFLAYGDAKGYREQSEKISRAYDDPRP